MLTQWHSLGLLAQAGSGTLPEFWEKLIPVVGNVAAAVSAIAAVIAFVVSYKLYKLTSEQLASTIRASNRQHRYVSSLESVKYLQANESSLLRMHEKILMVKKRIRDLEEMIAAKQNPKDATREREKRLEQEETLMANLLNSVEMFALSVNSTVMEIGLANDYLGSFIEHVYKYYGNRIREERRTRETAFRQLELFLNDLFELRRAKYVISARTIRCLQEELANRSLLDLLQRPPFVAGSHLPKRSLLTPGAKAFSWAELELELHKRGLGEEKYPILRHSMVKQFQMAELKVVDEGHGHVFRVEDHHFSHAHIDQTLQSFFRKTYEETKGQYPLIPDDSPEALERYVRQTEVLKRWVAVRETSNGPVIVGHISCTDLAQDGRAVWDTLFDRIRQEHRDVDKHQYLMLQELYVREEERNAGIARMLIRHALWTIEEQILPRRRKESGEVARPQQRVALTVVRHPGFETVLKNIYSADGANVLLGAKGGKCCEIRFSRPERTIHLCVLGF
jgi:GNAT superfamily N-acetyltransferase